MPIDPQELANLDPDDGFAHVDAIRELAVAIQEIQGKLLVLQSEVDDLASAVASLENKPST
jgi:hypothetical protein